MVWLLQQKVMQILREWSTLADHSLNNLPNSLDHTQPHSLIANL